MMKAWMVVNEYLRTKKFKELDQLLEQAAQHLGIEIEVFYNSELPIYYGISPKDYFSMFGLTVPDFVLFWDKDVRLATWLTSLGLLVYNSAQSIALCDDIAKYTCAPKDPKLSFTTIGNPNCSFIVVKKL